MRQLHFNTKKVKMVKFYVIRRLPPIKQQTNKLQGLFSTLYVVSKHAHSAWRGPNIAALAMAFNQPQAQAWEEGR